MSDTRPSWDDYFISIAFQVAERSTCIRRHVGAIIVKDRRILGTGYNGVPTGLAHCDEIGGCIRQKMGIPSGERHEFCRACHAEQNAIIQAARYGTPIDGCTFYTTTQPCVQCTKMILNTGAKEVVFVGNYPDELSRQLLKESGIIVRAAKEYKPGEPIKFEQLFVEED
jgi:dCMP deaminase